MRLHETREVEWKRTSKACSPVRDKTSRKWLMQPRGFDYEFAGTDEKDSRASEEPERVSVAREATRINPGAR